jgi:hypothetical protein
VARRSGKGRSRRRGGKQQKAKQNKPVFDPEKHFMPPPVPRREYDPDPISGEPISDILTAVTDPETGKPANFDSVVRRLEEQEELAENERIVYVGRGAFGVLVDQKGTQPRYYIRKRIQVEDEHEKYSWRRELAPGISRDYTPEPQPLSDLYDEAEATVRDSGYGKAQPSIYLPKND